MSPLCVEIDLTRTHMDILCHTCRRVISHLWLSHVTEQVLSNASMAFIYMYTGRHTRMDESRYTCGWCTSHMWLSHVTVQELGNVHTVYMYTDLSHTHGWVMSHVWMSNVTHMDEACRTCGWFTSRCRSSATHIWPYTYVHASRPYTHRWVISHMWTSHVTLMLIYFTEQELSKSYMAPTYMYTNLTRTHMDESRDTFGWVTSHMDEYCHTCGWLTSRSRSSVIHTWPLYICALVSRINIRLSHVTHMDESCHTYKWVMSHIWISHVTHM